MFVFKTLKGLVVLCAFLVSSAAVAGGCVVEMDGSTISFNSKGTTYMLSPRATFTADIQARDLTSSHGKRLANFAAVLQQNRANVHRLGPASQQDAYFTTLARRSELSTGRYYGYCDQSSLSFEKTKNYILNARVPGYIWVVKFMHPDGKPAFFLSVVG